MAKRAIERTYICGCPARPVVLPIRIWTIHEAYSNYRDIPWDRAMLAATCYTIAGARRRYNEERSQVKHGNAWSGHVRILDDAGQEVQLDVENWLCDFHYRPW